MTDYLDLALTYGGFTSLDKVYLKHQLEGLNHDQKLAFITPPPSVINAYFAELYQKQSPQAATDYYFDLSKSLNLLTSTPSFAEIKPFVRLNLSGKSYGFAYVNDQEEALAVSDRIAVMNNGVIQQIGTPEKIYNEPENAFVADFIGESNIISATMVQDRLVKILGVNFPCVDEGFGQNRPVDVVIRPEDVELVEPEEGIIDGTVISIIFKGVHYEIIVVDQQNNKEWIIHTIHHTQAGIEVGLDFTSEAIHVMRMEVIDE